MKVIAAPGLKVPMEHNPKVYITDAAAVEIPHTHYYVRRLASGELVEAPDTPAPAAAKVAKLPRQA